MPIAPIVIKPGLRLTIVAPAYRQKPHILAQFLNHPTTGYVRFEGTGLHMNRLLTQIHSMCGDTGTVQKLSCLILDECDRSVPTEFDKLLRKLLVELPNTHIVVFSRRLPDIIHDKVVRHLLQIVPENVDGNYAVGTKHLALEVQAFGSGRVTVNGREITDWRGNQFKELFFFMIDNVYASRHVISNNFWAHLNMKAAMNTFHVIKRQLHKILGFKLIEHMNGVYTLSRKIHLRYDVAQFFRLIEEGIATQDEALLLEAYQMCRYDFLQQTDALWIKSRRQEILSQYAEALLQLANIKAANGYSDAALGLYHQLRLLSPQREDIAYRLMSLYLERGEPDTALQIYHDIADYLMHEVGLEPDASLRQLGNTAQEQTLKKHISRRKRSS